MILKFWRSHLVSHKLVRVAHSYETSLSPILIRNTVGDILVLGPSAWSTLHKYPSMLQEYNEVAIDAEFTPSHKDGRPVCPPVELEWNREGVANHAAYPIRVNTLIGRMSAANLYLNQCRRLGIPITWNTAIVDYEENTAAGYGVAVASDGTRYQADIIVAADGLASKSHRLVLGKHVRAVGTGYTIFRAGIPAADCPNAPLIKEVIRKSDRPIGRAYAGHNHHAVLVLCDRLVCINITLPDDVSVLFLLLNYRCAKICSSHRLVADKKIARSGRIRGIVVLYGYSRILDQKNPRLRESRSSISRSNQKLSRGQHCCVETVYAGPSTCVDFKGRPRRSSWRQRP